LLILLVVLVSLTVFVSAVSTHKQEGGYDIEIYVEEGWNLVHAILPQYDIISFDGEIQISDIKTVFYYSPIKNKYIEFYPSFSQSELSERENNDGLLMNSFWIYTTKAGYLKYITPSGYPEQPEDGFYQEVFRGWNFVSIIPEMIGKTLEDIKGNCDIENAYQWVLKEKRWGKIPKENVFLEHKSPSGIGMIIKVTNDCTLGTSTNIPQLPQ
jgi:hypothetical protein